MPRDIVTSFREIKLTSNSRKFARCILHFSFLVSAPTSSFLHTIPMSEHGTSPHSLRLFRFLSSASCSVQHVSLTLALLNAYLNIWFSFEQVRVVFIPFSFTKGLFPTRLLLLY
ncbi:rCG30115 [Rattus norvegicus]|uniref:RCG30115 n=1 Tax=Rattus norvegicus TaxID=10116 RepID=A6ILY2_RAT|nr:rCG30115 [Rattus norvegicus]